jgi:mannose-1-phosphate guanylyltransferase
MIAVLMVCGETDLFSPLLPENTPVSFLPMTQAANLLSYTYSWINSHISQDKIFVLCTSREKEIVHHYCPSLPESNIILEPNRIDRDTSIFYASLFIDSIGFDEMVTFIPVTALFSHNFTWSRYLQTVNSFVEKNARSIVIPSSMITDDSNPEYTIDAGRSVDRQQGFEIFRINRITPGFATKKLFGKQGSPLPMLHAASRTIIQTAFDDDKNNGFINSLYRIFQNPELQWNDIDLAYQQQDDATGTWSINDNLDKKYTIFLDTMPEYLHNWSSFFNHFAPESRIYCAGNVIEKNCRQVICFNFDQEAVDLQDIDQTVIVKRNGTVTIKKIYL